MDNRFEIIARAVVVRDGRVLVCRARGKGNGFFPGGHIEFSEPAESALVREFSEEIGKNAEIRSFIGAVENIFSDDQGTVHHEMNLAFEATIGDGEVVSKEGHLAFDWVSPVEFTKQRILPENLASAVATWLEDGESFWKKSDSGQ